MRDKIAAIVGSAETADQVLQLFEMETTYETPPNGDPLQDEMPEVLKSHRHVRWCSPREPAYEKPLDGEDTP